jgi:hypothetical protein
VAVPREFRRNIAQPIGDRNIAQRDIEHATKCSGVGAGVSG